jgi:hypothetical protein
MNNPYEPPKYVRTWVDTLFDLLCLGAEFIMWGVAIGLLAFELLIRLPQEYSW